MRRRLRWRWLDRLAWQVRWTRWWLRRAWVQVRGRRARRQANRGRAPRLPVRLQLEALDDRILPGEAVSPLLFSLAAVAAAATPALSASARLPSVPESSASLKDESLPPSPDWSWLPSDPSSGSGHGDAGDSPVRISVAVGDGGWPSLWTMDGVDNVPVAAPPLPQATVPAAAEPPAATPNRAGAGGGSGPRGSSTPMPVKAAAGPRAAAAAAGHPWQHSRGTVSWAAARHRRRCMLLRRPLPRRWPPRPTPLRPAYRQRRRRARPTRYRPRPRRPTVCLLRRQPLPRCRRCPRRLARTGCRRYRRRATPSRRRQVRGAAAPSWHCRRLSWVLPARLRPFRG